VTYKLSCTANGGLSPTLNTSAGEASYLGTLTAKKVVKTGSG
jgi:hypothetical protein